MGIYTAQTTLEVGGKRVSPGDKVTDDDLANAGQDAKQIAALVKSGALKEGSS